MRKLLSFLLLLFLTCSPAWAGVDFDGTDDSISLGSNFNFSGTQSFTASAWAKCDAINNTEVNVIVGNYDSDTAAQRQWAMFIEGNGTNTFRIRALREVSPYNATGTTTISTGTWFHIAATYDGTNVRLYYNGALESTTLISGSISSVTVDSTIGALASPVANLFDGQITEVAIWNTALSAQDILNLAKSKSKRIPLQISPSNLQAYYPLDDQPDGTSFDGDTARDLSSNARNGTGNDGAGNANLTAKAEEVLSYP